MNTEPGKLNRTSVALPKFKVVDTVTAARHVSGYKNIVFDTAAHPRENELHAVIEDCDHLLIMIEPDAMSLRVLPRMIEDLTEMGSKNHRIVISEVPPLSHAVNAREFIATHDGNVLRSQIRSYAAFILAALQGVTVDCVRDEHARDGWQDYYDVARKIFTEKKR